jgi:hypothetical protein
MGIKIELEVSEIEQVLGMLAEHPYKLSQPLINKIQTQAIAEVNKNTKPPEPKLNAVD